MREHSLGRGMGFPQGLPSTSAKFTSDNAGAEAMGACGITGDRVAVSGAES